MCLRSGSVHLTLHSMHASHQVIRADICREFTTEQQVQVNRRVAGLLLDLILAQLSKWLSQPLMALLSYVRD